MRLRTPWRSKRAKDAKAPAASEGLWDAAEDRGGGHDGGGLPAAHSGGHHGGLGDLARSAVHSVSSITRHHYHHHHYEHGEAEDGKLTLSKEERRALVLETEQQNHELSELLRRQEEDSAAGETSAGSVPSSRPSLTSSASSSNVTTTTAAGSSSDNVLAATDEDRKRAITDYSSRAAERRFAWSVLSGRDFQSRLRIGKLSVRVIEAANLPGVLYSSVGEAATSNPYCVLSVEGRAWRTKTARRDLNPRFYEETTFHVHRHDAVLRLEIFDEGEHHDDRLGVLDVEVARLAGHKGHVTRWFRTRSHLDWTSSAVLLQLRYDVSPLGEACSMLWLDPPKPPKPLPPFDINDFYKNAMAFRKETTPYLDAIADVFNAIKWVDPSKSRVWLFVAFTLAAYWHKFFALLHFVIAALMIYNFFVQREMAKLKKKAAEIFARIDTNNSKTLSLPEVRKCIHELNAKTHLKDAPSDEEMEATFKKYAKNGSHELTLSDWIELVEDFPDDFSDLVGNFSLAYGSRSYRDGVDKDFDDLDGVLDDDALGDDLAAVGGSSSGSSKREVKAIKGKLAKRVLNTVGRRVSFLAYASRQFDSMARDLALLRKVISMDPTVSADLCKMALAGNLFLCVLHNGLPTTYFFLVVAMAFFYYSEKRRTVERFAKVGSKALTRYRGLVAKDPAVLDGSILIDDGRPALHDAKIRTGDVRTKALQSVVRGIFSRIDTDANGIVEVKEFIDFVLLAIPRATPGIRHNCQDAAPTDADVEKKVRGVFAEFSADPSKGEGITLEEMTNFIIRAGCARILVQDELRRQLTTSMGLSCVKLPSRYNSSTAKASSRDKGKAGYVNHFHERRAAEPSPTNHVVFGSHQTQLALRGGQLSYTNRHGHAVTLRRVHAVEPHPTRPHILHITHEEADAFASMRRGHHNSAKTLILSMSEVLRDNLFELLDFLLLTDEGQQSLLADAPHTASPSPSPKQPVKVVAPKATSATATTPKSPATTKSATATAPRSPATTPRPTTTSRPAVAASPKTPGRPPRAPPVSRTKSQPFDFARFSG